MDYKIVWSPRAIGTLEGVVRHIANFNPEASRGVGQRILAKVQLLNQFPRLGHVFAKLAREDVREVTLRPYRIIYQVRDGNRSVTILAVWHGAREEPEVLL